MNRPGMMCASANTHSNTRTFIATKYSKKSIQRKAHTVPRIRFERQQLTSFAGLVLLQPFLAAIALKASLAHCSRHTRAGEVYGRATVFLQHIIHPLLGYRDLRESAYYCDDPMVKRLLGLKRLPDASTPSRMLKDADTKTIEKLRSLLRRLAGLFAHNLVRELQMRTAERSRGTTDNRAALWIFERVDTVRKTLLRRAGRLTRPQVARSP